MDFNNEINKVVEVADIVQVISEYITLEKKGNDYKGLCPFHNDKTPSLSVSPSKKVFKCFSCNTAGNVIQFVQKFENISFIEALKKVSKKAGIEISIKENPQDAKFQKFYKITNDVCDSYEFYLKNTIEGQEALKYLYDRNINDEIIKHFRIGLSSSSTNLLVKAFVETEKYLPLDMQEIGLIATNDKSNGYYDMFKNRIMFPLKDLRGNIVGFSGRIYNTKSNSKYINSNENIIFKKSNILYNYFESYNEIKQKQDVIIFEGFMDVIAAYKANVTNTIATMGTALTEEQIRIILKLTKNITLCYDGDEPGIQATKRAIKLFSKFNVACNVIVLPDGLDPDDYLNKYGKEATSELLLNKRVSSVDYLYIIEKKKLNLKDSNSITSFQRNVYDLIDYFQSYALKSYLFNMMAKDLSLSITDIQNDYDNNKKNNYQNTETKKVFSNYSYEQYGYDDLQCYDIPPIESENDYYLIDENIPVDEPIDNIQDIKPLKSNNIKNKQNQRKIGMEKYDSAERGLIYLSYNNKDTCYKVSKGLENNFVDKINREILQSLYEYYHLSSIMKKEEFIKKLDQLHIDRLNDIINTVNIYSSESLDEFIKVIKVSKYKKTVEENRLKFLNGQITPEELQKNVDLKKKLIKIKKNNK